MTGGIRMKEEMGGERKQQGRGAKMNRNEGGGDSRGRQQRRETQEGRREENGS